MSIFNTDETAWSALTKAIENVVQPPGAAQIVQAPTLFQQLEIGAGVNPKLAMYRKLMVGNAIPNYGNKNRNSYERSGASLADAYGMYLNSLNAALVARDVNPPDQALIRMLHSNYSAAQMALKQYRSDAEKDWKARKKADPSLDRLEWDNNYGPIGYTPGLNELRDASMTAYGAWQAKAKAYPELARLSRVIQDFNDNPVNRIPLPTNRDDLEFGPDYWQSFYKMNLDVQNFFEVDAPQFLQIHENSSVSTSYQSRWSAGGSVSYGFFSVGGSADGGNVERHLRAGTQRLTFSFKRLIAVPVIRGQWYDEGLLRKPYVDYVDKATYWAANGQLPMIPQMAVIGRGLQVSIDCTSAARDEFHSWRNSSGGGGFRFGPWSIGASGGSSTSSSSITDTSTGTRVSFTDNTLSPYIVAVVSLKMDDFIDQAAFHRLMAEAQLKDLVNSARRLEADSMALVA
jgi:hypothetical protein